MNSTDCIALAVIVVAVSIYYNIELIKELIFSNDDAISAASGSSSDIVEVIKENNKNYLVLFASQTGTAEDYAKKFAKELTTKFDLNVLCADVEKYEFENLNELPEDIIVSLFISTYGEGDFPDGAVLFEEYLTNVTPNSLENIKFTIFGLGNTTYEFFNGAGEKALNYFLEAGSELIGRLGAGDDGKGTTDEDYLSWKEESLNNLKSILNLAEQDTSFKASFKMETLHEINDSVSLGEPSKNYLPKNKVTTMTSKSINFNATNPCVTPIIETHELFKNTTRNCIHTEFDISDSNLQYETGDHLAIWPSNADEKVQQFIDTFKLEASIIFDMKPLDPTLSLHFPCPTTIEATIRHYLEITGPLSRQSFGLLAEFAPKEIREFVRKLANDKDAFASEITSKKYNLCDALLYLSQGQPWDRVPWEFLVEVLPPLQPRYYSISSSSNSEPNTIHVTSIVENTANMDTGIPTLGVTTNLLRNISLVKNNLETKTLPVNYDLSGPRRLFEDYKLPVHVRKSNFKLPSNANVPVIMVGPGTGVAPFRGFVRDRVNLAQTQPDTDIGKMLLFYGCRDESDYLYSEEWPLYAKALGTSFEISVAFSRVTDQKVYVQHKLADRKREICQLLDQGAYIYVCGDASRMAKDVQKVIKDIIAESKGISQLESEDVIKAMKVNGTYQEDVW